MAPIKEPETTPMSSKWSQEELEASVDAYLSMCGKHLAGEPFVKKDFYRDLSSRFGRSEKSFEWRFQNISHVLTTLGKKPLTGLLPASNVGHWVIDSISAMLKARGISHLPNIEGSSMSEVGQTEAAESTEKLPSPLAVEVLSQIDVSRIYTGEELSQIDVSRIAAALPSEVSQLSLDKIEAHVSIRTFNVLKRKIEVLKELTGYSDGELLRLRNFGEGSLDDLKKCLVSFFGDKCAAEQLRNMAYENQLSGPIACSDFSLSIIDVSKIAAALPSKVGQWSVDQIEAHVSVRTFNVLKRKIEVLKDLTGYSDGELLRFRNFGGGSLDDLKRFLLRAVGPDVDMNGLQFEQRDFFKAIGIAVPEWLLKLEIPYLDLSARVRNGLKSLGVERLEELREYSPTDLQALGNFGVSSLACLCKAIQGRIVKGPPEKESYADTLLEAVCLAVSVFSHRDSSIIRLRFGISEQPGEPLGGRLTLEACAEIQQVTRERVRQIQKKSIDSVRNQRWVQIINERLSKLLDGRSDFLYLADLPSEDPWFLGCDGSSDAFAFLLSTFCPKFHCYEYGDKSGKYVVIDINSREFRRAVNVTYRGMSTLSPMVQSDLESHLSASALSIDQFGSNASNNSSPDEASVAINAIRESLPVAAKKYVGCFIRLANLKPQTISAKVVPTVASFGESGATFQQIVIAGQFEGSESGLRNYLLSDPEISKIGPSKFALKIYNHETYETVSEELVQRINRDGGETSFSALIEELKVQFNLKESTIVTNAKSPRFVLDGDVLRLATALEIKEIPASISDTKDWWKLSAGVFRTTIRITQDMKRGMGFAITNGVGAALGVQFRETQTFVLDSEDLSDDSEDLTVRVSWPETALFPTISALRLALEQKNMQDCSHVALDFDTNKHTVNLQTCDIGPFHVGGISLPPMGPGIEFQKDTLTELANRMGLSRALSQVCEALIRRRLPDVAEDLASLGDGADWPGADRLVAKLKSDLSYRGSFEIKESEWGGPLQSLRLRHPSLEVALINPQLLLYSKDLSARNDVGMLIDTKAVRSLPGQGLNTVDLLVHVGFLPERDVYILFDHTANSAPSNGKIKPEWFNRNLVDKVMLGSSGIIVSREQQRLYVAALSTRLDEAFKMLFEERITRCLGDK